MSEPVEPVHGDISESLRKLALSLVGTAQTRFDLLRVELAEERGRVGSFLYHGAALCFLAFLTLELLVLAVVAFYWDGPYRLYVVGLMLGLSLLATVVTWASIRRRPSSELLATMAEELRKDSAAIESLG